MGPHRSSRAELREALLTEDFSGVTSVQHNGHPLLQHAAGWADREAGRPIRIDTRFPVASISKMFTAVCLVRLVEASRCRFDQALVEIRPELKSHFDSD